VDLNRRQFLKVLGVTGAAATVEGCSRGGHQKVIPYLIPREELKPGVNVEFATVCRECPAGCGMIASVRDGRCHKVEGNPDHPVNRGKLCMRGQSAVQGLYNPDRVPGPMARNEHGQLEPISWDEAERRLQRALFTAKGKRAVWIGGLETGTLDTLIGRWLAAVSPNHTRLTYEPLAYEPLRAAAGKVLGKAEVPEFRIADAKMLISFGADFLETWVSNVEYTREFAAWRAKRHAGKHNSRYVFVGPRLSLTGGNADEWICVRPGAEGLVAHAMAAAMNGGDVDGLASSAGVDPAVIRRLAEEFRRTGPSLALPVGNGGAAEDAAADNEAVLRLNQIAGNVGKTVITGRPHALGSASTHAEVMDAVAGMKSAAPGIVFIHGANPAYSLPGTAFEDALKDVPEIVSFSSYPDETTALATLVLPDNTPLESWGEYSPRPGVNGLMQPAVTPVFDTRPTGDVLLASAARMGHDLGAATLKDALRKAHPGDVNAWNKVLQLGGVFSAATGVPEGNIQSTVGALSATPVEPGPEVPASRPSKVDTTNLVLHVYPSGQFYDGRTANRPWMQEIPDSMVKAVWNSWAEIHRDLARRLKVDNGDVVTLTTSAGKVQAPVIVSDHVHPQVVALQIGQGHTHMGRYADGTGVNAMTLLPATRDKASGAQVLSGVPVHVSAIPVKRQLVILQTSFKQAGRLFAGGMTMAEMARERKGAAAAEHVDEEAHPEGTERPLDEKNFHGALPVDPTSTLYHSEPPHDVPEHWGMAIDLDLCTGCNACVAACYSENNVPVVGAERCSQGREMAWLRIENYIGGLDEKPLLQIMPRIPGDQGAGARKVDIRFSPMLCQQCDNAPCEYVCPVDATMHSGDHLNEQVYNRCVGTRYCSNNCPYKVRRFNWFNFDWPSPLDQQVNPDVTVRRKGVMEKCTFCVQRIRRARIDARAEDRPIRDGEIVTACQQTCPADAIVFGNLNDPTSEVNRIRREQAARGYGALAELNTYPNITYLSRVRAE
jgi:molybdopterin-containing oxidoreductase family iron-sulfur binding subunit